MTPEDRKAIIEAIEQADAIFALEDFQPTEEMQRIDEAVLAGRVSYAQVADELREYAINHKSARGFLQTRAWR